MRKIKLYSFIIAFLFLTAQVFAQEVKEIGDTENHENNIDSDKKGQQKEIAFRFETKAWKKILNSAKQEGKPIFIQFMSENCIACNETEQLILTNSKLARLYADKFVLYRPEIGSNDMKKLVSKYKINSFPALIFIEGNGQLIHKYIGFADEDAMVNMAESVSRNKNTLQYYNSRYKKLGKKMPANELFDYSIVLMNAGEDNRKIVADYFNTQPEPELNTPNNIKAIMLFTDKMYSREFIFLAKNRDVIENSEYKKQQLYLKVEDVISNSFIKSLQASPKINMEDSLEQLINFFNIENVDALKSRVYMDYYEVVKPNKELYFKAIEQYLRSHMNSLDLYVVADKVEAIAKDNKDMEVSQNILNILSEIITQSNEYNEELYMAYIDLLVKSGRVEEAQDFLNVILDRLNNQNYSVEEIDSKYKEFLERIDNKTDSFNMDREEEPIKH